jgi:hypothetical protein
MRALAPLCLLIIAPVGLQGCEGCSENTITAQKPATEDPHDIGSWLSMRSMKDGSPAVAYYDKTMDALGFSIGTVKDGAVTWKAEEVDSYPDENGLNPGDAGKYASMVIDGQDHAWIAYQDTSNGVLKYALRGDGKWKVDIADLGAGTSGYDAGYWASIALDADGYPYIAHYDAGKSLLRVVHWDGSAFGGAINIEGEIYDSPDSGVATAAANVGEYAKAATGPDGTEYIAFYDRAWGALRLAVGNKSGYAVETVDDDGDVGAWPDILVDGDTLYIAYQDVGEQDLRLATGRPGSWSVEVVDSGAYVGADAAIYSDGRVGILYFDGVNNDVKLARQKDGGWATDAVAGTDAALGYHNETVLAGGARYAACYDYTNRGLWFSALN